MIVGLAAIREDIIGEVESIRERLRLVVVGEESDARVIFPPPEHAIADWVGSYAIDPGGAQRHVRTGAHPGSTC